MRKMFLCVGKASGRSFVFKERHICSCSCVHHRPTKTSKKVRFPIGFVKPIDIPQKMPNKVSFSFSVSLVFLWPSLAQRKVSFPNFIAFFYSNPSTQTKSRSHWFSFFAIIHPKNLSRKVLIYFFVKSIVKKCFLSNLFFGGHDSFSPIAPFQTHVLPSDVRFCAQRPRD